MEKQDQIIKFLGYDGKISVICANTTALVEKAREVHDLSPIATATLGRTMTIASMMGAGLKGEDTSITIQINGTGPIGTIVAVIDQSLHIKGYVSNSRVDIPLKENGKLDVGGAVGTDGYVYVMKDLRLKDPYIGMSKLVTGEIAEDFANYFAISEQTNTAVSLGVLVDNNGTKAAGGYLITPMPDATEEMIEALEDHLSKVEPISIMIEKGMTLQEIAKSITGDENIKMLESDLHPMYECSCSKEKMRKGLCSIGKQEIEKLIQEDGKVQTVCHFCNKSYDFSGEELEKMIEELEKNQ